MDKDAILEKVTSIFAVFENGPTAPDTGALVEKATTIAKVLVIAGPVIMLILGLLYLFAAPREANHHFGYRCYFGMGSEYAWRFTQRLAGFLFAGVGLVLSIVMFAISISFSYMQLPDMVWKAASCLVLELIVSILLILIVNLSAMYHFDRKGKHRRKKRR